MIPEDQLRERMGIIAGKTDKWIRTFATLNGLEKAGSVAHSFGFKAAIRAWLSNDTAANEAQIERRGHYPSKIAATIFLWSAVYQRAENVDWVG